LTSGCANEPKISPVENTPITMQLPDKIILKIRENPEKQSKFIIRAFQRLAIEDTVPIEKVQNYANLQTANARSIIIQNLLKLDANGDAKISPKEMLAANFRKPRWSAKLPYHEADLNDDDIISFPEIFIFAQDYAPISIKEHYPYESLLGAFDTNKDAKITRSELIAELETYGAFQTQPPKTPSRTSKKKAKINEAGLTDCKAPPPKDNTDILFLSGNQGTGLSSVAVTGLDRETQVARLIIEKGEKPLYIMASSGRALIWEIKGDVNRISKFVVSRNPHKAGAGVGVTGLPKDKITFLDRSCHSFFTRKSNSDALITTAKWTNMVGSEPDHVITNSTIFSMKLPSGVNKKRSDLSVKMRDKANRTPENIAIQKARQILTQKDEHRKSNLFLNYYDGLVMIDPKTVIAPEPVKTYDVFPNSAGISQLIKSKHLKPLESRTYKIVKPIARFPAGLHGGHRVKFILGKNIPYPEGDPSHSPVYMEKTGKCLSRFCR